MNRRTALALGALPWMGSAALSAGPPVVLRPASRGGSLIERAFFGMHIHHAERIPWPTAGFGTWRLWDAGISWADIQPAPDEFRTGPLDRLLDLAERHGVEVLLPLALTPAWASSRPQERSGYGPGQAAPPADMADWARFVGRLVRHARGRVRAYEVWNEANIAHFFTGDAATLATMARHLREAVDAHDPGALVLAPSGAGLLDTRREFVAAFLAAGGGRWVHALNFHLYSGPHPPEVMVAPVRDIQAMARRAGVALPLWNTESGYWVQPGPRQRGSRHNDALPVARAAAYLVRSQLVMHALGVQRSVVYAWDDSQLPFVLDDDRTPNAVGEAYAAAITLLAGARLKDCTLERDGPCVAWLEDAERQAFMLAWAWRGTLPRWRPPGGAGPWQTRTLRGQVLDESTPQLELGEMPIVLRRRSA